MSIKDNITREEFSYHGGGVELNLTAYGYQDEFLSAYQNYLGGGLLGSVSHSCTIEDWQMDQKLVRLAGRLTDYFQERMQDLDYIDKSNEITLGRPVNYPEL